MKRTIFLITALLALSRPGLAQQEDHKFGTVTFGLLQRDSDTISSKFLEYRDLPQGAVAPLLSFAGNKGDFRYSFYARDVTQRDQVYVLKLSNDSVKVKGSWFGIPHDFGNGGRSILNPVTQNEWRISDTAQQAYQTGVVGAGSIDYDCRPRVGFTPAANCFSLLSLVTPGLDGQPPNVDLRLTRGRGNISFSVAPKDANYDVGVAYFRERRSGTRAANGTSFGFGNVVETPEPLRYITQEFGVYASLKGKWGSAKAAIRYNDFKNSFDTFVWDNPFRATNSTDPSAYTGPSTGSRNGPVFGRTALPPDNKAWTESLSGTFKFGDKTRLTADLAFGQWKQNEDPFIPWTTNTAVFITRNGVSTGQRADTAPLPATALDGKVNTTSLGAYFTTRFADNASLNVRYRRYDFNNKTPVYSEQGYVRFDAVWEEIGRQTVPYGYTNDVLDASVNFGIGIVNLEGGWKYNRMDRTFRETTDTKENLFKFVASLRKDWIMLRALGEFGSRDYDEYDAVRSEDASFLTPGPPANQTVLRRFDQAKRDVRRWGGQLELSPGSGKFGFFASYLKTKLEYDSGHVECEDVSLFPGQAQFCPGGEQAPLGLVHDDYDTFTAEANFNPSARATLYAFYSWEAIDQLQTGRQSAATVNFSPLDVWTGDVVNKVNSVGVGADFTLSPDKWFLGVFGRYQDVDGNNNVSLLPGFSSIYGTNPALRDCTAGNAANPCAIRDFDDTKLTYVSGWLKYKFAKQWTAGAGVGFEEYKIGDSQTGNVLNYMPASFFLQANNRDYQAWTGWLNLTYTWQ